MMHNPTVRHGRWLVVLSLCSVLDVVPVQPGVAATAVQVKFVDHYHHGRIKLAANDVSRRLSYGEVKGPFAVTPDSGGNDFVYVESLRYTRCGETDIGYYFRPGHRYKIVVTGRHGPRCEDASGAIVHGPHAEVIKVG
jgi:hypothetical protein